MTNHYRSRLSGDEIRDMKQTMGEILEAITYYLSLPEDIGEAVKDEILWYDPRRQISKSRLYGRMYERKASLYFYDLVTLYVIQFATFEPLTRTLLQANGQSSRASPGTPPYALREACRVHIDGPAWAS
ncbi:hypothetical protein F5X97DRAFT_321663 [Nemania serpens]|nr:hypothetical protein F5X97DRAFT_321663 [Nemania serpens]